VTWTSGASAVASVSAGGLVTGLASGTTTLSAAKGSITGSSTVTVTMPTLTTLAVTPASATVAVGGTTTFSATGTFSDGTTAPVSATWSSSNTVVATVNASTGMVTGGSTYGTATITATIGSLTATGTVINAVPFPVSLSVTPANPSVLVGSSLKLTASATWSDGSITDASGPSSWSTSSASIASIVGAGTVTGVASGTATITATFTTTGTAGTHIVSGHVTLNVTAAALTQLAVTPSPNTLSVGGTVALTAMGTYADAHTANLTASVAWTSSSTAVATVSANGAVTAQAAGTATITATLGAITGTASVTVSAAATLTSITVAPASQSMTVGDTYQYVASGSFSNGTGQTPLSGVTWTTSASSVATTSAFGVVSAVGAGSANIIATLGSISGQAALTVTAPAQTFDPRLVGNWKWLGFPDINGNSYGSFYSFYADGTFTYQLIYQGSGINCLNFNRILAWHQGTFSSSNGQIIFNCTLHYTDETNCGGSTTRFAWGGTNPHFHNASFADANHLVTDHSDDFYPTGSISHVKY
jgi:uncharacterized protein YjdB